MITKTQEEIKQCKNYLASKGVFPQSNTFFYEKRDGEITACMGILIVGMLEPLAGDNILDAVRVTHQAQGFLLDKVSYVTAMANTQKEDFEKNESLFKKDGFQLMNENTNLYIKGL